jgi:hypothetical protein
MKQKKELHVLELLIIKVLRYHGDVFFVVLLVVNSMVCSGLVAEKILVPILRVM